MNVSTTLTAARNNVRRFPTPGTMATLQATPSPIVVDNEAGKTDGTTNIDYLKAAVEELWERFTGGTWTQINPHVRTGRGDEADRYGSYPVTLKPGQNYEVCVYTWDHGPLKPDPIQVACVKVYCLWKKPHDVALITDENESFGGTWYWHQVHTNVPTNIVEIGVSRNPPVVANGIPHLESPDGGPSAPLVRTDDHQVEIKPLLAGNHYFFLVVVIDDFGNWDIRKSEFTAFRRQLTVEFPTIHIFNDGDPFDEGEGEFWFRVFSGDWNRTKTVFKEFHRDTQDIDDWGETDRPYSLGFTHVGAPEVVPPGGERVWVSSWGIEHDGFLEGDEAARSWGRQLPLPAGRFVEKVTNSTFLMDCPAVPIGDGDDDDFHYGVLVRWSVDYVP